MGRGEGSKGKTAGRGTKGTKARYQVPARFEGGQMPLHMRLPKLRGFKNPFRVEYQVVNLDRLSELFPDGGEVTVEDLVAKGAVRKGQPVKVLGNGELTVALRVSADAVLRVREGQDRGGRRIGHRLDRASGATGRVMPVTGRPIAWGALGPSASPDLVSPDHLRPQPAVPHRALRRISCSPRSFGRSVRPTCARRSSSRMAIMALFRLGSVIPTPGVVLRGGPDCIDASTATAASTA